MTEVIRSDGIEIKKKVIQQMAKGEKVSHENSGLSKREWNELMISFGFKEKIV